MTLHGRRLLIDRVAAGRPVAHVAAELGISRATGHKGIRRRATTALADLGARARFTRRYRPQTNGKAERFNRTLAEEWAYAQPFTSSHHRAEALAEFPHRYNHHRAHTSLGGKPPITRVNNLTGQCA
ncbi:integrase core domain-containing protein [Amycolatopsis sp. NPDC049159]|uniref:integrase core domain-containing protein n=1 Tax=Amycolatopsis sp. NPDC049159 TaxID=3157210 RepID=UPI0034087407